MAARPSQTSTRTGTYRRHLGGYVAFFPAPFPPRDIQLDDDLILALSRADRALARLDGAASVLPEVDLFISMYVFQEATLSSQIEGTQASLADVVAAEADPPPPERLDAVREIQNYVKALRYGIERLSELPVSLRLVREIHEVLMTGVRGGEPGKTPGEFRKTQNWIGGSSPSNARFVPPPIGDMEDALTEWERAIHEEEQLPPLVRVGLLHGQFETIHPFLDGNGRVGRLLITFLLTEWMILSQPLLYLSTFFKSHQDEYYARLQATRDTGDWESWLRFFVDGVAETALEATSTVRQILDLRERDRKRLGTLGRRSGIAYALHDHLFSSPVVNSRTVQRALGVSQPTANSLVRDLEAMNLLTEWTGKQRNRSWLYAEYLGIFVGEAVATGLRP